MPEEYFIIHVPGHLDLLFFFWGLGMGEHLVERQEVSHLAIFEQDDSGTVDAVVPVVLGADEYVIELNDLGEGLARPCAVALAVVCHSLKRVKYRVLRIHLLQGVEAWV